MQCLVKLNSLGLMLIYDMAMELINSLVNSITRQGSSL